MTIAAMLFASPAIAVPAAGAAHEAGASQRANTSEVSAQGAAAVDYVAAEGSAAAEDSTSALRRPCDYVYGAKCVTWVTDYYSCHNIFQITTDVRKHKACALFIDQNIVTVWP